MLTDGCQMYEVSTVDHKIMARKSNTYPMLISINPLTPSGATWVQL